MSYIDQLIYEDHNLKLIVPTVIGPQYISNKSEIKANNEVSDDDYKLRLNLLVEPLTKIVIESPSHDVEVEWDENNLARVSFKDEDAYLDEEFVLVFKEENQQEASGMIYDYEQDDESKGILYLRLIPDLESNEEEESKNYDFLIDISESMEGEKIEQAKMLFNFASEIYQREIVLILWLRKMNFTISHSMVKFLLMKKI